MHTFYQYLYFNDMRCRAPCTSPRRSGSLPVYVQEKKSEEKKKREREREREKERERAMEIGWMTDIDAPLSSRVHLRFSEVTHRHRAPRRIGCAREDD